MKRRKNRNKYLTAEQPPKPLSRSDKGKLAKLMALPMLINKYR